MDSRSLGLTLMGIGAAVVAGGWLLASGWLGWFGRLPGDVRIVTETTRVYVPITSMLLVSLVLTLVVNVVRRLF
jgi:hypothetical protein